MSKSKRTLGLGSRSAAGFHPSRWYDKGTAGFQRNDRQVNWQVGSSPSPNSQKHIPIHAPNLNDDYFPFRNSVSFLCSRQLLALSRNSDPFFFLFFILWLQLLLFVLSVATCFVNFMAAHKLKVSKLILSEIKHHTCFTLILADFIIFFLCCVWCSVEGNLVRVRHVIFTRQFLYTFLIVYTVSFNYYE